MRFGYACLAVGALLSIGSVHAQSPSFDVYVNPVIPGDHPDPTLTRVGDTFYTTGSSFNPTPKIYSSTDLVHWEVIAQPVSATWGEYGDTPGGGIWGGHMVQYNGLYWHFFGRGSNMHFVTAARPEGPWGSPIRMRVPAGLSGLGRDNSIFIDDDNRWFLLVKNGEENNYIVELGENGQPSGEIYDLTWLNPEAENYPYGWAEGPVMWKHDGTYYYSFAQHLAGDQYVMRSDTLTDDESAWTILGSLFESVPDRNQRTFRNPNHSSPAVTLPDGTTWIISQAYYEGIGGPWMAQGRQPVLSQVTYDGDGRPVATFPANGPMTAPNLPSGGIPWMVPKSDMFDASTLNPEWSFLGRTPESAYSLTERPGWLRLKEMFPAQYNTVIKNDGEHSYSLMTRMEFDPESSSDEAGLWIFNGLQTLEAKLFRSVDDASEQVVTFSFDDLAYSERFNSGTVVWLKIERENHTLTGFLSSDGADWLQVGEPINVSVLDGNQPDFNAFTGNRQGPYARGAEADFDLYIYRDAYSRIPARHPANYLGVVPQNSYLGGIHADDWAMYAGVEFGDAEPPAHGANYQRTPDSVRVVASSATDGGVMEIWLDSIVTGRKVAEIPIERTAAWTAYDTMRAAVDVVEGRHDVYVRFVGDEGRELFRLRSLEFTSTGTPNTSIGDRGKVPTTPSLDPNYPNPFTSMTRLSYELPNAARVRLSVFDLMGRELAVLVENFQSAGRHTVTFDGSGISSGTYFYRLEVDGRTSIKMMTLTKIGDRR